MEYIKTFENYSEDLIVEKLNLRPLLDKLKSSLNKNKIATLIIGSLLSVLSVTQVINFIENRLDLTGVDKTTLMDAVTKYKDPSTLKLSHFGWNHIKNHEKLILKAYRIGDGKITIGYGHATPIQTSKYKVGHRISKEEADRLFIIDINIAAEGVKRIFEQWKEQGINVKITQNQYDVMVSMTFNMGVTSFRTSKFIQMIKNNNLEKAAELIKTTGINDKFPGLEHRRLIEYKQFVS